MSTPQKILQAAFYVSVTGKRPVRQWLMELSTQDRKTIGEDIATLEFCWPVGMPKCSPMKGISGLYEIRSNISAGRIARVFFVMFGRQMALARLRQKDLEDARPGTETRDHAHEGDTAPSVRKTRI